MESPAHKANILGKKFTHIGVAYNNENGHQVWVEIFSNVSK